MQYHTNKQHKESKLLNEEITPDIHRHKQTHGRSSRCTLGSQAQHTYMVYPTENDPTLNNYTVRHATHKTIRSIDRSIPKIQGYNITLTTTQVQEAINLKGKYQLTKYSQTKHQALKHIGPLGLAFLTSMFKTALNNNIIPPIWKSDNIGTVPSLLLLLLVRLITRISQPAE